MSGRKRSQRVGTDTSGCDADAVPRPGREPRRRERPRGEPRPRAVGEVEAVELLDVAEGRPSQEGGAARVPEDAGDDLAVGHGVEPRQHDEGHGLRAADVFSCDREGLRLRVAAHVLALEAAGEEAERRVGDAPEAPAVLALVEHEAVERPVQGHVLERHPQLVVDGRVEERRQQHVADPRAGDDAAVDREEPVDRAPRERDRLRRLAGPLVRQIERRAVGPERAGGPVLVANRPPVDREERVVGLESGLLGGPARERHDDRALVGVAGNGQCEEADADEALARRERRVVRRRLRCGLEVGVLIAELADHRLHHLAEVLVGEALLDERLVLRPDRGPVDAVERGVDVVVVHRVPEAVRDLELRGRRRRGHRGRGRERVRRQGRRRVPDAGWHRRRHRDARHEGAGAHVARRERRGERPLQLRLPRRERPRHGLAGGVDARLELHLARGAPAALERRLHARAALRALHLRGPRGAAARDGGGGRRQEHGVGPGKDVAVEQVGAVDAEAAAGAGRDPRASARRRAGGEAGETGQGQRDEAAGSHAAWVPLPAANVPGTAPETLHQTPDGGHRRVAPGRRTPQRSSRPAALEKPPTPRTPVT